MHCHLDKLEEGVEAALTLARAAGVSQVVTIGTEPADHPVVLALSQKYYPEVFCTLGVHPHEGVLYTSDVGQWIEKNLHDPGVIAVGKSDQKQGYENVKDSNKSHHRFKSPKNRGIRFFKRASI